MICKDCGQFPALIGGTRCYLCELDSMRKLQAEEREDRGQVLLSCGHPEGFRRTRIRFDGTLWVKQEYCAVCLSIQLPDYVTTERHNDKR